MQNNLLNRVVVVFQSSLTYTNAQTQPNHVDSYYINYNFTDANNQSQMTARCKILVENKYLHLHKFAAEKDSVVNCH